MWHRAGAVAAPAAVEATATAEAGGPTADVTFKSVRRVAFGQVLKVVGSHPELGNWDAKAAPGEQNRVV